MNTTINDELFRYAESLGFGDIHFKFDSATQLCAIIAIHSTKRGPALGGCRCIEYASPGDAIKDALRLARGMSFKAAMANLPLGGGKAVLMKPKQIPDRDAYFAAVGRFVNELNGRYITAMDSGVTTHDMDMIATQTPYVTNLSAHNGDPAPFTALGVRRAIEAAVKFKLGRDSLAGLHVAIQGVGNVGYDLAKDLHHLGAKLTVCDRNSSSAQRCADELGATIVDLDAIYSVQCDVFAPCALGAVLNDTTIPLIKASIIVGSANNQLAEPRHAQVLQARDILYAPDYVASAGGLIFAYGEYKNMPDAEARPGIIQIYDTLLELFARAERENKTTSEVADIIALERL